MRPGRLTTARSNKAPYFTYKATVEVDIDPDDLYDAGWHRQEDCEHVLSEGKAGKIVVIPPPITLAEAVGSLHRQAHPAAGDILLCHEQPCRSLTLDQMRERVMIPGGTHGHMHAVLDGLTPHAAVQAVGHEFPGWHVRETPCGVWADTTNSPMPGRVDVRAPDAYHMWQELTDYEWHWFTAAIAPHGHQGVTSND